MNEERLEDYGSMSMEQITRKAESFAKNVARVNTSITDNGKMLSQWIMNADNCYLLKMNLQYIPNENFKKVTDLIYNTLKGISLSQEEISECQKLIC